MKLVVYVLCISMIALLGLSFRFSRKDIISPAVAFLAPFSLATIDLIYNIDKWKVDLKWNTFWLILGGTLSFLFAIVICGVIGKKIRFRKKRRCLNHESLMCTQSGDEIKFPRVNYLIFALFQLITFLICLQSVISISRRYGVSGGLSELIAGYKSVKTFTTEDVSLGGINNLLYDFCYSSGYIWFYIVAYNLTHRKKVNVWTLINLILSIAVSLVKGSRGGAIALICSGIAMLILFWQENSKRGKLSFKQFIIVVICAIIVVGTFQTVGELLGRVSSADFGDYLAVYLSAPIRNFDYYINSSIYSAPDIFGKMTFVRLINYFGDKFNIQDWVYELDLPSLYANGYVTGNVYTTFYAYVYDFGYIGIPIMMFIMGVISQTLYKRAKSMEKSKHRINLWKVLYAYVFYLIAFSFFSNKFYEGVVAIQFVKYILYWLVIRFFMERVRFGYGANTFVRQRKDMNYIR